MFPVVEEVEVVDSTNDYLKAFIGQGRPRAVIAGRQRKGRGQYGRAWHSPPDSGLYVSYLFYPQWPACLSARLLVGASLAVTDSILHYAGRPLTLAIKQPNDVLIGGKKVAGILTELGTTGDLINWSIVGIGVNLFQKTFPVDFAGNAVSLEMAGILVPGRSAFCGTLTQACERIFGERKAEQWIELESRYSTLLAPR